MVSKCLEKQEVHLTKAQVTNDMTFDENMEMVEKTSLLHIEMYRHNYYNQIKSGSGWPSS